MIHKVAFLVENKNLKRYFLTLLFLAGICISPVSFAQEEDAQLRLGAGFGSDISKRFSWGADVQQRFNDNVSRFDQFLIEPTIHYKFASYFRLSGGYRIILFQDLVDGYDFKQRVNLDLRAKINWDKWSFKYRTRLQYGFDETLNLRVYYQQKLVNRNLIEIAYAIHGTRFTPYANSELFYYINNEEGGFISKYRIEIGTELFINKKSGITAYFIYEPEQNVRYPITSFIYGLKYSFDL